MKRTMVATIGAVVAVWLPLSFAGCSGDSDADVSSGFVAEVLDSVAAAVAENVIDTQPAPVEETLAVELAVKVEHTEAGLPPINDLLVWEELAYAGFDGGLLIYDLKSGDYSVTPVEEDLRAVVSHGGELFAGGETLYLIDGADLVPSEENVPGQMTDLCSFGPSLMIGSTEGLYARSMLGLVSLLEEVEVSALVADADGLWIGTAESGLYRWDGETYRRRFLSRDSSLFDFVTALDYNHRHLYLGTTTGLYIHDGGRWKTVSTEQGLPSNEITALDASGWVVYVGTGQGLSSYFDDQVTPVGKLGGYVITAVGRSGGRIIAGTAAHGLVLKVGPSVKTLVEPWRAGVDELALMIH